MGTSADYPYLDVIYKLCETMNGKGEFSPIMKLSEGKITLPGRKQVYRFTDDKGYYKKDVVTLADEQVEGEPLLVKVMEKGKLRFDPPTLNAIRETAASNLKKLPERYRKLTDTPSYPVELSQALSELVKQLEKKIRETEILNSKSFAPS
jgi:nicotinate phosphoribosyltransferase